MANYVGVDSNTGKIKSGWWESNTGTLEDEQGDIYVEITNTVSQDALWTNNAWVEPTVSVDELRVERDKLLKSSDEMITRHREHEYLKANRSNTRFDGKDYGNIAGHLTESKYHDWLVYRQDLRDLPDGYTPVADPTYPNKPS